MKGNRVLITGGTGFIGSWLTERWYEENLVTLFDNGRRNAFQFLPENVKRKVELVTGDIQNSDQVLKVVKGKDIIVHLAAIAGASFYEKDPLLTLDVNLFGTANLLKSLINRDIEQVIIASSSEVYGSMAVDVKETDVTQIGSIFEGRWSYAVSKIAADHLAFAYFRKYGMPITIVRPFNIYGPRQIGEGAVTNMLMDGLNSKVIKVTGSGDQKRAWCFVYDFVDAIDLICKNKIKGECFNIGNPEDYITILELAKKISTLCGGCKIKFLKGRKTEILKRKPSIERAQQTLGFNPKVNIDEGLTKTYQWWIENIAKF